MNEIYLVSKGCYSSYSIRGVFLNKELATEFAAQISDKWDTAEVETRQIMTELPSPVGFRGYCVKMDRGGNTSEVTGRETMDINEKNADYGEGKYDPTIDKFVYTGTYSFSVETDKGPDGAVKIANERRMRMIVENTWPIAGQSDPVNPAYEVA